MVDLTEKQLNNLLISLFAIKEIKFEEFEVYIWNVEKNKGDIVKSFQDFEKWDSFDVIFCLSNVQVSINNTPFTFGKLDFNCCCDDKKCTNLYLSPDIFDFNSETEIGTELLEKMEKNMKTRLSEIAQALFSLKRS